MWTRNNIGPNIAPWGTPERTFDKSDFSPFTMTHCFLLFRKESTQFKILFETPYL